MKKAIALILATVTVCLSLCSCGTDYNKWHNDQVKKGMNEAKKQLGR